jgi:hypothetical protein
MALPEVQINIQDPGLGIVPASAGKTQAKLGACSKGTPGRVYSVSGLSAARDALGSGPLLDALAQVLGVAGGPVLAVPLTLTGDGEGSTLALSGVGAGTIVATGGPDEILRVKIVLGGLPGTMSYQVKVGDGGYGATVVSGANPYAVRAPGQYFSRLVFANVTYVANDVYKVGLNGAVVLETGSGPATALDGSVHSPLDTYAVWVQIMASGETGTAQFKYSLDGGNNWSAPIVTAAKVVIPESGVVLAFTGTFTVDDIYKGTTKPASFGPAEVTAGGAALRANSSEWGLLHVVGTGATAVAAASMASTVGTILSTLQAEFKYGRGIVECPQTEGDTAVKLAFVDFVDPRVAVCVGDVDLISPITGRRDRRNLAWAYSARLSAIKLSSHPGQVADSDNGGPLDNVAAIYSVGSVDDLDANRFVTVRNLGGQPGYFISRGRMMASPGSDFSSIMNCRVLDRACTVARSAMLLYLNKAVRMDKVTGHIDERDALDMEAVLGSKLEAALISEDEASVVTASISRTDNLLSTSTLNVEVSVVPKGYPETIRISLGFKNPALQATS